MRASPPVAPPNGQGNVKTPQQPDRPSPAVVGEPKSETAPVTPASLPAETRGVTSKTIVELPGVYSGVTLGGGGRYVIFQINDPVPGRVVILDVTTGKIVRQIPGISKGDMIVAGMDHFLIISLGQMAIHKWSLKTLQREKIASIPGNAPPRLAVMGCAGAGPLLLVGEKGQLFDVAKMQLLEVEGAVIGRFWDRLGYSMGVSADGLTFAGVTTGISGTRFDLMHVEGNRAASMPFGYVESAIRWAWPTAGGEVIFAQSSGVFNRLGRTISAQWLEGKMLIPTVDPRYFLTASFEKPLRKTHLSVCTTADCRVIYTEPSPEYEELWPGQVNSWHEIAAAYSAGNTGRIQYIPWSKTLVTLPLDNKQVFLRPYDLQHKLDASSIEYLFVESVPPLKAFKGQTLIYPVKTRSKLGGLHFAIEQGPPDMSISNEGVMKWNVPADFAEPWPRVVISIKDKKENEALHSFELGVQEPAVRLGSVPQREIPASFKNVKFLDYRNSTWQNDISKSVNISPVADGYQVDFNVTKGYERQLMLFPSEDIRSKKWIMSFQIKRGQMRVGMRPKDLAPRGAALDYDFVPGKRYRVEIWFDGTTPHCLVDGEPITVKSCQDCFGFFALETDPQLSILFHELRFVDNTEDDAEFGSE